MGILYRMIKRELADKLKYVSTKFPVVILTGPRQSGKTTLVKSVFGKMRYFSLEEPDTRQYALADPRGFLKSCRDGAIIDEAQRAPELFSYIQSDVDNDDTPGRFIITSSQNIMLLGNVSQTLAGRAALLKLLPFSLGELRSTADRLEDYETVLFKGFYPRIYDKDIPPTEWYPNYIQTYVERDVRQIKNITDLDAFQKFLRMCAGRIGQVLNLSSLGADCGITHNTAKAWLTILEASYIVFRFKPYYSNFNKRLIKMPKLYFWDTGLACSLLGVKSASQLETHYLKGGLFESMVISEFMKEKLNAGTEPDAYFWRDRSGNEIDCLIDSPEGIAAVEIKSGKTVSEDFFAPFKYWNEVKHPSGGKKFVVYGGDNSQERETIKVVSWKKMLEVIYENGLYK